MVLNNASVVADDHGTAVNWLRDVASGMSELVREGVVASVLRMSRSEYEIKCVGNWTLSDAYQELRQRGERDAYLFLIRLGSKAPLLDDVGTDVTERAVQFRRCEERELPSPDGEPLVLCAVTDWVSVGFPSDLPWDRDRVTVSFDELLYDGSIQEVSETIDNLTRQTHAMPICERHRHRRLARLQEFKHGTAIWEDRVEVFPSLIFGPDVEDHLMNLNPGNLGTVLGKLAGLDHSARTWRDSGGPAPSWESKVTDENSSVRNTPSLREARRFRSQDGRRLLYMWHARFGNSGRIHLRFDAESRKVEIGYIGPHLPI